MDIHQTQKNTELRGKVYITGAGPGDPELITLRALRLLERADVIVYDRLVNPLLLSHTRKDSEHIYVGKRPDKPSVSQQQINRILVARANAGKMVVRLKGGDPFVFGRGGEECEALLGEQIPFEVVPGISSALSAPAFAGIPVTHRALGRSFAVVTGHTVKDSDPFDNWENLSKIDTLVILMGLRNLDKIAQTLIRHGRPADTPAAVIASASLDKQQVVIGTLETIGRRADEVSTPATVVVGELALMHHDLNWFRPQKEHPEAEENRERIANFAI